LKLKVTAKEQQAIQIGKQSGTKKFAGERENFIFNPLMESQ